MGLIVEQFPCLGDNFGVLLRDEASGQVASIDAPEAGPILSALDARGWRLDRIFVTHHHADHTGGIPALKEKYGCEVVAPAREADRPGVDRTVGEPDRFAFGETTIEVLDTPGHTLGHIAYVVPKERVAFVGDTLFSIGCGRVIEGTMDMMWNSLKKLASLPRDTRFHCGHEYTEANIRFALTIEPNNIDLQGRAEEVRALRAKGLPTLPATIGDELAANPFLRANNRRVKQAVGMPDASDAEVFAEIRGRKDRFK